MYGLVDDLQDLEKEVKALKMALRDEREMHAETKAKLREAKKKAAVANAMIKTMARCYHP